MLIVVHIWPPVSAALISKTGNVIQSAMTCKEFFSACPVAAFLRFSSEDVGGMVGELEFNVCIESVKLFQTLCSLGEEHSRIPRAVSEEQSETAVEKMKAAVNLCQQCQGWVGCSLQSKEEHVFIIMCHPSAEKVNFLPRLFIFAG